MQTLFVNEEPVKQFVTRADAIVYAFEQNLVYDTHSRKRNQLLPHVKIRGDDERDAAVLRYNDRVAEANSTLRDHGHLGTRTEASTGARIPERGSLDHRGRNSHLDLVQVDGKWRRL